MSSFFLGVTICVLAASPDQEVSNAPRFVIQSADSFTSASFATNDKWVLTGSNDRTARIWDAATGLELRRFEGHLGNIQSANFSEDGKRIVTASADKTVRVWNVESARELFRVEFSEGPRTAVFSPDGRLILVPDGLIARVLDAETGKELFPLLGHAKANAHINAFNWKDHVSAVAFARNGKTAATAGTDGQVMLWDLESRKLLRRIQALKLPSPFPSIRFLEFAAGDQQIFTAASDATIRLWDVASGNELKSVTVSGKIMCAAVTGNGKKLATGGDNFDRTVRIYDVDSSKVLHELRGHEGSLTSVCFSGDGKRLVSTSGDGIARIWDVETGAALKPLSGHTLLTHLAEFSRDSKRIAVACQHPMRTAIVWNAESGVELTRFAGHTRGVSAVGFSPDNSLVVTGSGDDSARIWETGTGKERKDIRVGDSVYTAAFSPDGQHILTLADNSQLTIWNTSTAAIEMQVGFTLNAGAYSPDGKMVVAAAYDGTMQENQRWARIWDVASRKQLRQLPHKELVHAVAFAPDGKHVATGSFDGTARLWNVETGKEVQVYTGHRGPVVSVTFSSDNKQIVTSSWDHTARIWNLGPSRNVKILRGHSNMVRTARFSADGKRVLTSSDDRTVRVWDSETGDELCQLVSFRKGWAVVDSEGRYDASNPAGVDGLHGVVEMNSIPLGELREKHYDPGLLAKHLGWNKRPLRKLDPYRPTQD